MIRSRQHIRLWIPGQSGGADLVTLTSQPHASSGHRYTCPSTSAITAPPAGLHSDNRLTSKAVRLYEARGLLAPTERTPAGCRTYTEADVARLQFIAAARSLGLHLNQNGDILAAAQGGQRPCSITRELLDERINEIDHVVANLSTLRDTPETARDTSALCTVLDPSCCT